MIKIGMEELERARQLQEEAAKLHLPSPPVASFKISRKERNGEEKELILAKSNSYLRNAYNGLTQDFTFAPNNVTSTTYFGDGWISFKSQTGSIRSSFPATHTSSQVSIDLRLGTNGTPDTLDDTRIEEISTSLWRGTLNRFSTFDPSTRRFITFITRYMENISGNMIEFREAGIYIISSSDWYLMIRDTFPAVTFAPGNAITFTYQLEVYYPSN